MTRRNWQGGGVEVWHGINKQYAALVLGIYRLYCCDLCVKGKLQQGVASKSPSFRMHACLHMQKQGQALGKGGEGRLGDSPAKPELGKAQGSALAGRLLVPLGLEGCIQHLFLILLPQLDKAPLPFAALPAQPPVHSSAHMKRWSPLHLVCLVFLPYIYMAHAAGDPHGPTS